MKNNHNLFFSQALFSIVASVIHLGDLEFREDSGVAMVTDKQKVNTIAGVRFELSNCSDNNV